MKKLGILMGAIAIAGAVNAGEGAYLGVKAGSMEFDTDYIDDAGAAGFVLGYEFGQGFSAEFESNYANPDVSNEFEDDYGIGGDFDYYTNAIYGVWRSDGNVYFKGKVGYLHERVETTIHYDGGSYDVDETDSGGSYGIGVGARFAGNWMAEAEYTVVESDVGYLSASISYHF